jgi:predicted RNA-binding Zn-ribbon protein involved in translation (DUF1610 family)
MCGTSNGRVGSMRKCRMLAKLYVTPACVFEAPLA